MFYAIPDDEVRTLVDNLKAVWDAQKSVESDDNFAVLELNDAEVLWTNKLLDAGMSDEALYRMYEVNRKSADTMTAGKA